MARYVAEGRGVTVVTCTAGEMGEVLVPDLEHLAYDKDGGLGERRKRRDRRRDGRPWASPTTAGSAGSAASTTPAWPGTRTATPSPASSCPTTPSGTPTSPRPPTSWSRIIRDVRPQVLVTYDEFGGYGHPDHIQAHRVATYAAALAAAPTYKLDLGEPHDVAKVYWCAMSESRMRESLRQMRAAGDTDDASRAWTPTATWARSSPPDDLISACIDGQAWVAQKMDALSLHRTQVDPDGPVLRRRRVRPRVLGRGVLRAGQGRAGSGGRGRLRDRPLRRALSRWPARPGGGCAVALLLVGAAGGLAAALLHQRGGGWPSAWSPAPLRRSPCPRGWWCARLHARLDRGRGVGDGAPRRGRLPDPRQRLRLRPAGGLLRGPAGRAGDLRDPSRRRRDDPVDSPPRPRIGACRSSPPPKSTPTADRRQGRWTRRPLAAAGPRCWSSAGVRRCALRRRRQGAARHDRQRRAHRRAPAGRGGRSGCRRAWPTGSPPRSRPPSTARRSRRRHRRRASRSTTRPPSPRPAARAAGTRSGCGTTSPAATTSRPW